jgi:hypothetical protein
MVHFRVVKEAYQEDVSRATAFPEKTLYTQKLHSACNIVTIVTIVKATYLLFPC